MRILVIARNTFRENVRDRVLYNLILFALVMIGSSIALGQLTLGHEAKVIVGLGLSSISVFGTLIAVFIGIGLVYKELEKRTAYSLLAKPVRRSELILGKYLGLLFTLAVNVTVMSAGLMAAMAWQGGIPAESYLRVLPAVCVLYLSLALTTALALFFSTFSTPALSALFTLFLWICGHFSADLLAFGRLTKSAVAERLCRILYYALPNMSNYAAVDGRDVIGAAARLQPLDGAGILLVTIYTAVYCAGLLALSVVVFSRRDLE